MPSRGASGAVRWRRSLSTLGPRRSSPSRSDVLALGMLRHCIGFILVVGPLACGDDSPTGGAGGGTAGGSDAGGQNAGGGGVGGSLDAGQCRTSDDCDEFNECTPAGVSFCGGAPECAFPTVCATDNECDGTDVCEPEACCGESTCRPACMANSCGDGQDCAADGRCAARPCPGGDECGTNAVCGAGDLCERAPCASDSECDGYCVDGFCYGEPGVCNEQVP